MPASAEPDAQADLAAPVDAGVAEDDVVATDVVVDVAGGPRPTADTTATLDAPSETLVDDGGGPSPTPDAPPETLTEDDLGPVDAGDIAGPAAPCEWSGPGAPLAPTDSWSMEVSMAPEARCSLTVVFAAATVLEVTVTGAAPPTLEAPPETESGWRGPERVEAGPTTLQVFNPHATESVVTLTLTGHGAPPEVIAEARSLVWTTAPMTESTSLAQLMGLVSEDAHGGALLQQWFERFASTAHSERLGPLLLLQAYEGVLGPDPTGWDLSLLPFHVTGIHNRLDLGGETDCGELRVSLASHDPVHKPLHLIFLFRQLPQPDDLSPSGALHCAGTALRWARLSELTDDAFEDAALTWIQMAFTTDAFDLIETVEFLVAPWEWRQWFLEDGVLDNRPLFQTVDIPSLNTPGSLRDEFLAWVAENAQAISERRAVIPEVYRSASARASQGVPWVPLDLSELSSEITDAWPTLRQQIELVGCPGCHTADAEFVQTHEDGTFSDFYDKELDARAEHLESHWSGTVTPPPFGALQHDPTPHP